MSYRKELLSPTGETYVSTSAVETNDLIYGSGYREADEPATGADEATTEREQEKGTPANPFAYGGEVSP